MIVRFDHVFVLNNANRSYMLVRETRYQRSFAWQEYFNDQPVADASSIAIVLLLRYASGLS